MERQDGSINRQDVILGLACCQDPNFDTCTSCPYEGDGECDIRLMADAAELLRREEQNETD